MYHLWREKVYTVDDKEQALQVCELCRSKAKETCVVVWNSTCELSIAGDSI